MNIKLLNYLKIFLLSLVILTSCSSTMLVDGLVNDLYIKVKAPSEYINPTIETITYEKSESPTLKQIKRLSCNREFRRAISIEFGLLADESESSDQERGDENPVLDCDEDTFSDWDDEEPEKLDEQALQTKLKTFDLEAIDSDFFTIEVWSKTKREFSVICYKSQMQKSIEYYTIIITPILLLEKTIEGKRIKKLTGYNCHLEGKNNPMDNIILHKIELKAHNRRFSISRKRREV